MTRPKTTGKSTTSRKPKPIGCVAFVGAGPGDPELLTVRAVELLAKADVVVTESQDADFVRRFCRDDVEVVDGSLGDDGQPLSHAVRARLVVKAAKGGGNVVRLLDGDPFLYATGSEEAVGCAKAGIPFEVVPGVSAITAVPAYAGIPLTSAKHREVRVVNVAEGAVDWAGLGAGKATLVLLVVDQGHRRRGQGAGRRRSRARDTGGDDPARHDHLAAHRHVDAGEHRGRREVRQAGAADDHRRRRHRRRCARRCRGSRPSRCSAGGCWCRAPRSRRVRCPSSCAPTARCPRRSRRSPSSRRARRSRWSARSRAWSPAATSGSRSPRATPSRPSASSSRSTAWTPARSPASRWRRSASRPAPTCWPGASSPTWCPAASSRPPDCSRTGRRTTRSSTRSTASSCRAPTSPPRTWWRVWSSSAGRSTTSPRTARCAPRRRPPRSARRSRAAGSTPCVFTSSSTVRNLVGIAGKPHTSTVIACIGPATAKTAEEHGLRVDVLAPTPVGGRPGLGAGGVRRVAAVGCGHGRRAGAAPVAEARHRPSQGHLNGHGLVHRDSPAVPGRPAAPAAFHGGPASPGRADPTRGGRPRAADVRPGGAGRADPDRVDARRRPALARLAAQGGGRGGAGRGRRADAVRRTGAPGRHRQRRHRRRRHPQRRDP